MVVNHLRNGWHANVLFVYSVIQFSRVYWSVIYQRESLWINKAYIVYIWLLNLMTWGSVTELCYKTWVCSLWCSLWIIESMATNERMFSLEGVILFLLSLFILIWSRISWILHYRTPIVFPWVCLFNYLLTVLSELRHFELFFASFELSFF